MGTFRYKALAAAAFCAASLAAAPAFAVTFANTSQISPNESTFFFTNNGDGTSTISGSGQAELGMRFAHLLPDVPVPFAGVTYRTAATGAPILPDCIAWLDCELESTIAVGDHKLFIGIPRAVDAAAGSDDPIVYCQRAWRVLARV